MSILSSVTSILEPTKIPGIPPGADCKPDDCDDDKQSKRNDDRKGRDDDHSKHAKHDDDHKGRDDDHSKHAKHDDDHKGRDDDHSKQAKCDDDNKGRDDDHSKHAKHDDDHKGRDDDHSKQAKCDDRCDDGRKDDHSKDGRDDHSKQAKNDDCQPHKDDCQPQKDHCDARPSDDCGKGHSPGEMLAKFDFSHGDLGSHAPDHSDMQGALASLSSDHALDYAIGQMGPADHFDIGHFDMPAETHHDAVYHA